MKKYIIILLAAIFFNCNNKKQTPNETQQVLDEVTTTKPIQDIPKLDLKDVNTL